MTTFWLFAAALITLALVLVLPPLIGKGRPRITINRQALNVQITRDKLLDLDTEYQRGSLDKDEYESNKAELEQALFDDVNDAEEAGDTIKKPAWLTSLVIIIAVPVASVLLYQQLGNIKAVDAVKIQANSSTDSEANLQAMISQLQAKLATDPTNTDGWMTLGRTYMVEESFAEAEQAYSKLLSLQPDNAEFMLLKADAMAMRAGGTISGEPETLILAALEKEPENFTGLWLAGMVAREHGDTEKALQYWNKLKGLLAPDSADMTSLEQLIAEVSGTAVPANTQQHDIASMVGDLEEKLKAEPQNSTGWLMLGRSYMILERFAEARVAFDEAYRQNPQDPVTLLALADAEAMSNNGSMMGRPDKLVNTALQLAPNNPKALWLAGMAAQEKKQNQQAIEHWQKLLPLIATDEKSTQEVKTLIQQAGGTLDDTQTAAKVAEMASVKLNISLADSFSNQVSPDETIFIYAKAFNGPPMPLAAARKQVSDLPLAITLDDSMAMMPQMKLSNYSQVIVGARISKSGQPVASPGDLFAEIGPVQLDSTIELQINQTVQ